MNPVRSIFRDPVRRLSALSVLRAALMVSLPGISLAQTREAEASKVYVTVLDALYQSGPESPQFIVVGDSLSPRPEGISEHVRLLGPHTSEIDSSSIADFETRTTKRVPLPAQFSYRVPVRVFRQADRVTLDSIGKIVTSGFAPNDISVQPFWYGFLKKFPGSWGLTVVSDVGFNPGMTQALVYVRHNCGSCAHGEVMFLKRMEEHWRVAERISDGSFESGGFKSLRYLGPDAHMVADQRRMRMSMQIAMKDSIARTKLPRRIRGTITNRQTGRPIPFAQVLMYGPGSRSRSSPTSPPRPVARVVADKKGVFTISNPAIGVAMLVFVCPGPIHFDRASFGAPGLYVFPGTDTTFDFAATDLSPCWPPTKIHPLESGWFESAEARNAIVPDDDERKVFAVVIKYIQTSTPAARVVGTYTRTMLACRYDKRCGSVQLARLAHEHVIDSSAVNEFRSRSAVQAILRPDFAQSLGLHVVTDGEFRYYSGEASSPIGWPVRDAWTDSSQFWSSFKKFNGAGSAIVSLTRAGFNTARSQALVEVRLDTGFVRFAPGPTQMMRLHKSDSTWEVDDDDVGKGATSGEWNGRTCEAVTPTGVVTWYDALKINGEFRIKVVSTAGNIYIRNYRVHIGRNKPRPYMTSRGPRNMGPFTFEAHDERGNYDEGGTLDLYIMAEGTGIPRNTDVMMLDGYHHYLAIRRITKDGFFGSFSAGVFADDDAGHFCAERISPQ
jgi:hypothetical protein